MPTAERNRRADELLELFGLTDRGDDNPELRWFQVVTLFNRLTYVSEGTRGALVPYVPHMRP